MMAGAAIFMLSLHPRLGIAALTPAVAVLLLTKATGTWVRRRNTASLQALGGLSAEVQESISNFRVVVAFNRADYFRERFKAANERNYDAAVTAGLSTTVFLPTYGLALNAAQVIVLAFGFYLVSGGATTVGLLIGFLPVAVLAKLFGDDIKAVLFNPVSVAIALVVGGVIILWAERRQHS